MRTFDCAGRSASLTPCFPGSLCLGLLTNFCEVLFEPLPQIHHVYSKDPPASRILAHFLDFTWPTAVAAAQALYPLLYCGLLVILIWFISISSPWPLLVAPYGLHHPDGQGLCSLAHPALLALSSTISLYVQPALQPGSWTWLVLSFTLLLPPAVPSPSSLAVSMPPVPQGYLSDAIAKASLSGCHHLRLSRSLWYLLIEFLMFFVRSGLDWQVADDPSQVVNLRTGISSFKAKPKLVFCGGCP